MVPLHSGRQAVDVLTTSTCTRTAPMPLAEDLLSVSERLLGPGRAGPARRPCRPAARAPGRGLTADAIRFAVPGRARAGGRDHLPEPPRDHAPWRTVPRRRTQRILHARHPRPDIAGMRSRRPDGGASGGPKVPPVRLSPRTRPSFLGPAIATLGAFLGVQAVIAKEPFRAIDAQLAALAPSLAISTFLSSGAVLALVLLWTRGVPARVSRETLGMVRAPRLLVLHGLLSGLVVAVVFLAAS